MQMEKSFYLSIILLSALEALANKVLILFSIRLKILERELSC